MVLQSLFHVTIVKSFLSYVFLCTRLNFFFSFFVLVKIVLITSKLAIYEFDCIYNWKEATYLWKLISRKEQTVMRGIDQIRLHLPQNNLYLELFFCTRIYAFFSFSAVVNFTIKLISNLYGEDNCLSINFKNAMD